MPRNSGNSSNRSRSTSRSSDEPLMSQWGQTAKDNPIKTAAVAAGAVAAGVFLWSKRNQISNQISELSDQISDWSNEIRSGSRGNRELTLTGGPNESSAIESSRSTGRSAGRSRLTGSSRSASPRSGAEANQTPGSRSQGENTTL